MSYLVFTVVGVGGCLSEVREWLAGFAARFDAGLLSGADAAAVMEQAAAIENMAATIKALAASRVADTGVWRRGGDRSAAHHLARTTGSSVGQAVEALHTARRLEGLPELAARARRGELSAAQSAVIAELAVADPGAEVRLLDCSRRASLAELRLECARVKAAAGPDPEQRRARIHRVRCLRSYTDAEGAWNLRARDNPEVGAQVMAALAPIVDRLFRAARAQGRREPIEAYAVDALAVLAATAATATAAGAGRGGGWGSRSSPGPT